MTAPLIYCDLIGDLPALAAQRWGERHAFTFEGESWSYQGVEKEVEQLAHVFDADGWYKSGDAGILRADGHVRFVVRLKDMLKVGGENVSPAEIEGLIAALPGVEYVAIVGKPDERLSEVPVAFIVSAPSGPKRAEQIISHCKGKIASFKIPVECYFVEALPMTPTGKIQKELLRTRLRAMLSNQNEG